VELLERVVAQDAGADLVGDAQHEGVAPTDGARRRGDELVVGDRFVELGRLLLVDAVPERGVHHDRDHGVGELIPVRPHRFVELAQARGRPALGCDVGAVDDDHVGSVGLARTHASPSS
jgi:hypothetical protein